MTQALPWTDEQIEELKQLAGTMSCAKIGVKLGRTKDAVRNKIVSLSKKEPAERAPLIQLYKNHNKREFQAKTETASPLEWCKTCHAPVSNWTEHEERTQCKRPSN